MANPKAGGGAPKATQPWVIGGEKAPREDVKHVAGATAASGAKKKTAPRHDQTLIGIPTHMPHGFPPLSAGTPAPLPAPARLRTPAPTRAPSEAPARMPARSSASTPSKASVRAPSDAPGQSASESNPRVPSHAQSRAPNVASTLTAAEARERHESAKPASAEGAHKPMPAGDPETTQAPSKREPSLVILSRKIANSVRPPREAGRFVPPAPPPTTHARTPNADRGASALDERTPAALRGAPDAEPSLPTTQGVSGASQASSTHFDAAFDADVALLTRGQTRSRGLVVAIGLAVVGLLALVIFR